MLCTSSGLEALELARSRSSEIALLVSDVVMPRMTGPECAREFQLIQPGIRVLFISGYSDEDISEDGVLTEGINLLGKPFTPTELLDRVRELLSAV